MSFHVKLNLPGKKEVWAKEISSGQYKSIVKSIYSVDDSSFIYHTNLVLESAINPEEYAEFTVIDKLVALMQLRAVSVSPDLKFQVTCEETKKPFEVTLSIEEILKSMPESSLKEKIALNNFLVDVSLIKAKDEKHFIAPYVTPEETDKYYLHTLVSSINCITVKKETVDFKRFSWEERCSIVERLPAKLSTLIFNKITEFEKTLEENKVIKINSPFTGKLQLDIPLTTNVSALIKLAKLVYTENLTNLYTMTYNLIKYGKFSGSYLDSITPVEAQIYWIYCQKQIESEEKSREVDIPRTDSEFT